MIYTVGKEIKSLCCSKVFHEGDRLEIVDRPSKNRVRVRIVDANDVHKVKRSTLLSSTTSEVL